MIGQKKIKKNTAKLTKKKRPTAQKKTPAVTAAMAFSKSSSSTKSSILIGI